MAQDSTSGGSGDKPAEATAASGTPAQPATPGVARPAPNASAPQTTGVSGAKSSPAQAASGESAGPGATNALSGNAPAPQTTVQCPKCGASVREVARFCQRCHMTMRFECPACRHQQRTGGKCEKCGVNFIKYVAAVVAGKRAEADALHERLEQRSTLMKNLLVIPFTGGFSLVRDFFVGRSRKS